MSHIRWQVRQTYAKTRGVPLATVPQLPRLSKDIYESHKGDHWITFLCRLYDIWDDGRHSDYENVEVDEGL